MAQFQCCGNDYDKTFEIVMNGKHHVFDSFECAVHILVPICAHCECKILGHGMEAHGKFYCCAHCAKSSGITSMVDRK